MYNTVKEQLKITEFALLALRHVIVVSSILTLYVLCSSQHKTEKGKLF